MQAAQRRRTAPHPDPTEPVTRPAAEQRRTPPSKAASRDPGVANGRAPAPTPETAAVVPPEDGNAETSEEWQPGEHDLIPLLPRGIALFDAIPARAVVLEELCPAVGDGALIVRRPDAVGVVLVRDGAMFERYAFTGGKKLLGDSARHTIATWDTATVSAYQFHPEIVQVLPSLLRGEPCYQDLRLRWADWNGLLADLCGREGSFVIELDTPQGRGVTCVHDGRQIATFTEGHPEFGEAALLDPLADGRQGTIWVWREPSVGEDAAEELSAGPPTTPSWAATEQPGPAAEPAAQQWQGGAPTPAEPSWPAQRENPQYPAPASAQPAADPFTQQQQMQQVPNPFAADRGGGGGGGAHPFSQPGEAPGGYMTTQQQQPGFPGTNSGPGDPAPFADIFGGTPAAQPAVRSANGGAAPGGRAMSEVVAELKLIARQRLQRSAAKVEGMLDEVVSQGRPLDAILSDIRGLVIRGVMQSTLDEVVDEMTARVRQMPT